MSIVDDQIRRLDLQLDKFQLATAPSREGSIATFSVSDATDGTAGQEASSRELQLKSIVRALSTSSSSSPLLRRQRLQDLLSQSRSSQEEDDVTTASVGVEKDLEWLVVAKATIQTYGLAMSTLLEQTIPLSDDIWYWDDVISSYANTSLYTVQLLPTKAWTQAKEVYAEAKERYANRTTIKDASEDARESITEGWKQFYGLVRKSIEEKSLIHARTTILSPFALSRSDARHRQHKLRKLREMNATGIGLLLDEGLSFHYSSQDTDNKKGDRSPDLSLNEWRGTVAKSVSLIEAILRHVTSLEVGLGDFEEGVFNTVEDDPEVASTNTDGNETSARPEQLADRLISILNTHLPGQESTSLDLSRTYGRPSRLIRYWPAATILLLSSGTLLRILTNRKAEIRQWIEDLGATIIDFWSNWVVDPVKKLIGTIRHDEDSEVAIMSKDSLRADRESLERMVVDFAADHPNESGRKYTASEIADIRAKVREGDLTPVLRAYERDLQSPFMGAVRGDLVRALLIQVQKTKVDVEVAIGGIDALLKSQELVFGLVGLTPGLLVSIAAFRWLGGVFGSRRGLKQGRQKGESVRLLRNVDRVLSTATPTAQGMLSYKDHGLLLCEVHVLRQRAAAVLPGNVHREFLEDVGDLIDIRMGIERQLQVVNRLQWAYAKWLR